MWFLFGEVSFSSGCLGWATLFYCGTPCAFHIIILEGRRLCKKRMKKSAESMMSHVKVKSECNTAIVILHTRYLSIECTLGIYVVNNR